MFSTIKFINMDNQSTREYKEWDKFTELFLQVLQYGAKMSPQLLLQEFNQK